MRRVNRIQGGIGVVGTDVRGKVGMLLMGMRRARSRVRRDVGVGNRGGEINGRRE